jgi:hypothetical protein
MQRTPSREVHHLISKQAASSLLPPQASDPTSPLTSSEDALATTRIAIRTAKTTGHTRQFSHGYEVGLRRSTMQIRRRNGSPILDVLTLPPQLRLQAQKQPRQAQGHVTKGDYRSHVPRRIVESDYLTLAILVARASSLHRPHRCVVLCRHSSDFKPRNNPRRARI